MSNKESHNFNHSHDHNHMHGSSKNLLIASFINLSFVIIEFIGGFMANSVSLISDAIHDLGDSISLFIAFIFEKKSYMKRDNQYTFGYRRVSVLGSFIAACVLFVSSLYMIYISFKRLINIEEVDGKLMLVLAIFGVFINGYNVYRSMKATSILEKTMMLHLLEDFLGWVAVAISSVFIIIFEVYWLDPLLALIIASFILFGTLKSLKKIMEIFLQRVPRSCSYEEVHKAISEHSDIVDVHDLHIWTLDGTDYILTAHVVVKEDISLIKAIELKDKIKIELEQFGINHSTLDLETYETALAHGELHK